MSSTSSVSLPATDSLPCSVAIHRSEDFPALQAEWDAFANRFAAAGFSHRLNWGRALQRALGQEPYYLAARRGGEITGVLPLVFVKSLLFGRLLVGLSYVNTGGVLSSCPESARLLIDRAVTLADELNVKRLELRHEQEIEHPRLTEKMTSKVHMRLPLPATADELMTGFKSKLRSQVKKSLANGQEVCWGTEDLLADFYTVFSQNMRDLGTPVFPQSLFRELLRAFPGEAELCVLRAGKHPAAGALLLHGPGVTQVPSASALRAFNATNANMRMYWHLLERAIRRGQSEFDFGRSTQDGGTFKFKEQWGAAPHPAVWQYYVRSGQIGELRPESGKYRAMIRAWQKLPLPLANLLGPWIVRGIP